MAKCESHVWSTASLHSVVFVVVVVYLHSTCDAADALGIDGARGHKLASQHASPDGARDDDDDERGGCSIDDNDDDEESEEVCCSNSASRKCKRATPPSFVATRRSVQCRPQLRV